MGRRGVASGAATLQLPLRSYHNIDSDCRTNPTRYCLPKFRNDSSHQISKNFSVAKRRIVCYCQILKTTEDIDLDRINTLSFFSLVPRFDSGMGTDREGRYKNPWDRRLINRCGGAAVSLRLADSQHHRWTIHLPSLSPAPPWASCVRSTPLLYWGVYWYCTSTCVHIGIRMQNEDIVWYNSSWMLSFYHSFSRLAFDVSDQTLTLNIQK